MLISRFPPTVGGTEIQCYRLSTWLARQGHQVVVLTEKSSATQPTHEQINGFDVVRFRTWGAVPLSSLCYAVQAFTYLLRHPHFDILHAHMMATPAVVAAAAGRLLRVPVLVKIAGGRQTGDFSTSHRTRLGRTKLRLLKILQPYFVCPSQEIVEETLVAGIPGNRIAKIPNGVDADHFRPPIQLKSDVRKSLGFPDVPTAIYVGRWAKGKGVENILKIWETGTTQPIFPWHLILVLTEKPPEAIAERIRRLANHIHFVPSVSDPLPYYQASDLAILLSEGEGISNFLLEAMSCGLPALTSRAAALSDSDGAAIGTYTLMTDDPTKEILSILNEAVGPAGRLTVLGEAARKHIGGKYAIDHVGKSYVALYEKI